MPLIKNKTLKILNILFFTLYFLTSCVADEFDYPKSIINKKIKSDNKNILVVNDIDNMSLYIKKCNVGKISRTIIEYGDTAVILCYTTTKIDTIVFDGELHYYKSEIYKGLILIPYEKIISFKPSYNWFDDHGNKLLHPITFDANVNDWK